LEQIEARAFSLCPQSPLSASANGRTASLKPASYFSMMRGGLSSCFQRERALCGQRDARAPTEKAFV